MSALVGASDAAYAVKFELAGEPGAAPQIRLSNQTGFGQIRYRTDGREPDASSPVYAAPLPAKAPLDLVATTFFDTQPVSAPRRYRIADAAEFGALGSAALTPCREGYNLRVEDDAARDGIGARFGERHEWCLPLLRRVLHADLVVIAFHRRDVVAAQLGRDQARAHAHRARRIGHVHHRPAVVRRDLHGRVHARGRRAADQQRHGEAFALHLVRDVRHLF